MNPITKDEFEDLLRSIADQFDDSKEALEILAKHSAGVKLFDLARAEIDPRDFRKRQIDARKKRDKHSLPSSIKILRNELDTDLHEPTQGRREPSAGMDIQYGGYE